MFHLKNMRTFRIRLPLAQLPMLRALQSPSFTLLWFGQTISILWVALFSLALAWKVVLLTGSATAMGVVVVAQIIPTIIFVLLGGVIADQVITAGLKGEVSRLIKVCRAVII